MNVNTMHRQKLCLSVNAIPWAQAVYPPQFYPPDSSLSVAGFEIWNTVTGGTKRDVSHLFLPLGYQFKEGHVWPRRSAHSDLLTWLDKKQNKTKPTPKQCVNIW